MKQSGSIDRIIEMNWVIWKRMPSPVRYNPIISQTLIESQCDAVNFDNRPDNNKKGELFSVTSNRTFFTKIHNSHAIISIQSISMLAPHTQTQTHTNCWTNSFNYVFINLLAVCWKKFPLCQNCRNWSSKIVHPASVCVMWKSLLSFCPRKQHWMWPYSRRNPFRLTIYINCFSVSSSNVKVDMGIACRTKCCNARNDYYLCIQKWKSLRAFRWICITRSFSSSDSPKWRK